MAATTPFGTLRSAQDTYCTKVIKREKNFTWTIENFSLLVAQNEKKIMSPLFSSEVDQYKWALQIEPKYDDGKEQYVSVYIWRNDSEREGIYCCFSVRFMNFMSTNAKTMKGENLFYKTSALGWCKFVERKKLLEILGGDVLVIKVHLTYSPLIENSSEPIDVAKTDSLTQLSMDFTALYENSKYCDVTICANDTEIKAHTIVLTARSPVFAAMFEHDTVEKKTKRIDIPDIDIVTLRALIHFMYSGKIPNMNENLAKDLLKASEKYALYCLKNSCSDHLTSYLTTANVVEILLLADLYRASELKENALKFICDRKNSFDFVKHGSLLEKYGPLTLEILKRIAPVIDPVSLDDQ